MRIKNLNDLKAITKEGIKLMYPERIKIAVGMATCGLATGAQEVYDQIDLL